MTNRTKPSRVNLAVPKLLVFALTMGAATACFATFWSNSSNGNAKLVKILFADDCPVAIDPSGPVELSRDGEDRIVWQAVDQASGEELDVEFNIYYDPFVGGSSNRHARHGSVKSALVHRNVPVGVEYKYTIVAEKCQHRPLDPRILTQK